MSDYICNCGKIYQNPQDRTLCHARGHAPDYKERIAELEDKVEQLTWNQGRVCNWIRDEDRKVAHLAFTAGAERQIAYAVEDVLNDTKTTLSDARGLIKKAKSWLDGWTSAEPYVNELNDFLTKYRE